MKQLTEEVLKYRLNPKMFEAGQSWDAIQATDDINEVKELFKDVLEKQLDVQFYLSSQLMRRAENTTSFGVALLEKAYAYRDNRNLDSITLHDLADLLRKHTILNLNMEAIVEPIKANDVSSSNR